MNPTTPSGLAPATLDAVILAGLESHGKPVPAGELAYRCAIDSGTDSAERQDSIDRLIVRGQVRKLRLRKVDPRNPLFDMIEVILYEAIGGHQ